MKQNAAGRVAVANRETLHLPQGTHNRPLMMSSPASNRVLPAAKQRAATEREQTE